MKKFILAASLAATLLAGGSASAAQMISFTPPEADGSFTGMFGNMNVDPGAFTDTYTFNLPTGVAGYTISSIFNNMAATNNIDFTSVAFNGTPFSIGSTGNVEFRFLQDAHTTAGSQTLVVSGVSGGNGTYDGTIAFARLTAVPEPASWAMMMMGFGGLGAMMRTNRRRAAASAA